MLKGHTFKPSRCFGHPECPMTAGYYIGGGHWLCWLHTLFLPGGAKIIAAQTLVAMPTVEQAIEIAERREKNAPHQTQTAEVRKQELLKQG